MPYNHPIPDAPCALSMLPRDESPASSDLIYLAKPNAPIGQRSKAVELSALFGSDPAKYTSGTICSNILEYSGALASTSANLFTEVCHLDVDPRMDVEFHVWGTSNQAGSSGDTYNNFDYGLLARARQHYDPDDDARDLVVFGGYAGHKDAYGGPTAPVYNDRFGLIPYDYSSDIVAAYPTKRVTLFLAAGATYSPYHASVPSEFNLKIQATIYPSKYVSNVLKATTP